MNEAHLPYRQFENELDSESEESSAAFSRIRETPDSASHQVGDGGYKFPWRRPVASHNTVPPAVSISTDLLLSGTSLCFDF